MPDSWSKKKKEAMNGKYHRQKPDKDNCEKAVTDTLWPDDDSMIADGRTTKRWAYSGSIEMEVST
jgi:Holliday junction resolvase RusA-like endonuclease